MLDLRQFESQTSLLKKLDLLSSNVIFQVFQLKKIFFERVKDIICSKEVFELAKYDQKNMS